jgi:hypothetical protein
MKGILVDSNVILDVFLDDPNWAGWSESKLEKSGATSVVAFFLNRLSWCQKHPAMNPIHSKTHKTAQS